MDAKRMIPEVLVTAIGLVVLPAAAIAAVGAGRARSITCPASRTPAAVKIGRSRAVLRMFTGVRQRVTSCSFWPERAACDRACEAELF